MRPFDEFCIQHFDLLKRVAPGITNYYQSARGISPISRLELGLRFLDQYLPGEKVNIFPTLILGYASLGGEKTQTPKFQKAYAIVRHFCTHLISPTALDQEVENYKSLPESFRCFDIVKGQILLRRHAHSKILSLLDDWLISCAPRIDRKVVLAQPGTAAIILDQKDKEPLHLHYTIPEFTPKWGGSIPLEPREKNPPIEISWKELVQSAQDVDHRESQADWPRTTFPMLHLESRLKKVRPTATDSIKEPLWDGEKVHINKTSHLVGMLSSGKSTFVLSLLFALSKKPHNKKIALLVPDTVAGAQTAARLNKHGIKATVMASFRRRKHHLNSIHWHQGHTGGGFRLDQQGALSEGFSTACPLDGFQPDLSRVVARGDTSSARWPQLDEKQCHSLCQKIDKDGSGLPSNSLSNKRSCPLFPSCPAQSQAQNFHDANVIIMTPQAFIHMTPDPWICSKGITFPELMQYWVDMVIIDEVDNVQRILDEAFAPKAEIMGDNFDVYAPNVIGQSFESLRRKSGVQYRKVYNNRWLHSLSVMSRLVGIIYALLQNEAASLSYFIKGRPFTGASILYRLWLAGHEDETELHEETLRTILHLVAGISKNSETDEDLPLQSEQDLNTAEIEEIGAALKKIGQEILLTYDYAELVKTIEEKLNSSLKWFNVTTNQNRTDKSSLTSHDNAIAILLAISAQMFLAHYNWVVKNQEYVSEQFDLDEGDMVRSARHLIKQYRTLLPGNPSGAIFGLLYEEPPPEEKDLKGGKLSLINHLGIGRYLLSHLHSLLQPEGQAGPHVLLLSGTSWAGGGDSNSRATSSPCFDVQVDVSAILRQPHEELRAIEKSFFKLVPLTYENGKQVRVSGESPQDRPNVLDYIAKQLFTPKRDYNQFESDWLLAENKWGMSYLKNRRRVLLVVNSYKDALHVGRTLQQQRVNSDLSNWQIYTLIQDDKEGVIQQDSNATIPRSLVEDFGLKQEYSILVAPIQVISRGHNILNSEKKAAISLIYFLHRPHPRPDDMAPVIGELNRYAMSHLKDGMSKEQTGSFKRRADILSRESKEIIRSRMASSFGYGSLSDARKQQFAWDFLAPTWQTIGRGIRNGCPVGVGFIDRQFAPHSFSGKEDSGKSSVLVKSIETLADAIQGQEGSIAKELYGPLFAALKKTEGLLYGENC